MCINGIKLSIYTHFFIRFSDYGQISAEKRQISAKTGVLKEKIREIHKKARSKCV